MVNGNVWRGTMHVDGQSDNAWLRLNGSRGAGYLGRMSSSVLRIGLVLGACALLSRGGGAQGAVGVVRPGDRVALMARDTVDTVPVSAVGRVVLPLVGPIAIAGLPLREAEDSMTRALSRVLARPDLRVTMLRRVVVDGAVRRSSVLFLDETIGLSAAIALAGGLSEDADTRAIELWRDGRLVGRFDERQLATRSPPLDSGDQVRVARLPWAARNAFIVASLASNLISLIIFLVSR